LNSLASWIFADKKHYTFYLEYFTVFDKLKFNIQGFLSNQKKSRHSMIITVSFFDFYLHVKNYRSFLYYSNKVTQIFRKQTESLDLNLSLLTQNLFATPEKNLFKYYGFFYRFAKMFIVYKKLFKVYFKKFDRLLYSSGFKLGFLRIHKHFFPNFPVTCIFEIKPYLGQVNAKFIAIYLERKVRTGTSVYAALRMMHKYLRRVRWVVGYRVVCAGRFQRGKMAGYVSRFRGVFSYGRYYKNHALDYATSTADLKTGLCGFKVWVCFSPLMTNRLFLETSGQFASKF
jgi:hypothetical protein